jgi:hypothetical protein
MPPQPSPTCPQLAFWPAQVNGAQASALPQPHWFGPEPPHVWPVGHVPHWTMPPHLGSVVGPQFALSWAHVEGTQGPPASTGMVNVDICPPVPPVPPMPPLDVVVPPLPPVVVAPWCAPFAEQLAMAHQATARTTPNQRP